MVLKNPFCHSVSAAALACFLSNAPAALADYPGEIWSVDSLSIKLTGESTEDLSKSKLRTSLQRANDIYFFGEQPVRMQADVSSGSAPTMRLTLVNQSDGSVIARSPKLAVLPDGASIESSALAWMERLTCAQAGCAAAPEVRQPVRVAKAHLNVATRVPKATQLSTAAAGEIMAGIPMPIARPLRDGASVKRGKASIGGSGLAGKDLGFSAVPIQIALSIPREVGALTYGDADQLTLNDSVQVARVSPVAPIEATPVRSVQAVPEPRRLQEERSVEVAPNTDRTRAPEETLFGRLLTRVASFLGIKPSTSDPAISLSSEQRAVRSVVQTSAERSTANARTEIPIPKASLTAEVPVPEPTKPLATSTSEASTWRLASEPVSLINPIDRSLRVESPVSVAEGERIAVADLRGRITDPANARQGGGNANPLSNQGLVRQGSRELLTTSDTVRAPRVTKTNLSVRLHPDLFGRYAPRSVAANRSVRSQGVKNASRTISGSSLGGASKLNKVLSERGMEIDVAGYNRFERIYWNGREDQGFWISMPNRIDSKFVLVSGPNASVIASVRRRPGIARTSSGVAEALELRPREWTKLRVISLRPVDQSAGILPLDWFSVRKGRNRIQ